MSELVNWRSLAGMKLVLKGKQDLHIFDYKEWVVTGWVTKYYRS
jgi:hypothetical protein